MSFIENEIERALFDQSKWEDRYDIPDEVLDNLAKAVVTALGLVEIECGGERWWSTKFYPPAGSEAEESHEH